MIDTLDMICTTSITDEDSVEHHGVKGMRKS